MRIAPRTSAAPVMMNDADVAVDAPDQSAPPEVDDFVAATPKPKPTPAAPAPAPAPAPDPAPAPTLADVADSAPKSLQETVLKQAGLDDDTLASMSDEQIADAFKQVVAQSGKPGDHSVTVHFDKTDSYDAGGESGGTVTTHTDTTQKLDFSSKSIGDVNGMKLDPAAVVATQKSVHLMDTQTVGDTLTAMGVDNPYMLGEDGMRELLSTAMIAARTPGAHEVTVHGLVQTGGGGDSGDVQTENHAYTVHFDSDKKGVITVDGKQLPTAQYIAMSQMLESVPPDQQRSELIGAGFPPDKVNTITPEEVHRALTHVSLELARPGGVKEFEVMLGGDDFKVTPKLDDNGKLESLEIAEKPKKKSAWKKFTDGLKKIVGPVLTVLSFIPVTAPFAIAANAALSVVNGIKNHNPLGIIAGIAGGVAGFAGNLASDIGEAAANGLASTAQTVANVANTASAGLAAIQGKNPGSILGFIAGAAGNLAGWVGDGAQDLSNTLRDVAGTASTAAQVANGVDAIRNHDLGGIVNAASGALGINRPSNGSTSGNPPVTDDGYVPFENNYPTDDTHGPTDGSTDPTGPTDETTQPSITPVSDVSSGTSTETVVVQQGDTLSSLAAVLMGDPKYAALLYTYNKDKIGPDGNLLHPGDELAIPPPDFQISRAENNAFWRQTYQQPSPSTDDSAPTGTTADVNDPGAVSADPAAIDRRQMYDLEKDFNKVLAKMTADGRRIDTPGWVNNLYGVGQMGAAVLGGLGSQALSVTDPLGSMALANASASIDPVSGCHGQAIEMSSLFNTQLAKGYPGWSFTPVSNYPDDESALVKYSPGSGYHWVIQATSPDGNRYMLDPNNGYMDAWSQRYDAWHFKEGDDSSQRDAARQEGLNRLNSTMYGP